ncbi:DJ-1/PfpI family protein [Aquimarina longa]|uniref:DJ-1/PfpI family protein n=1 Tax=Aquimarina longa TaxID=1080221 RepID=UPI0007822F7A|nr:DJ-1/PfpI family protein [Aquimarina longa]
MKKLLLSILIISLTSCVTKNTSEPISKSKNMGSKVLLDSIPEITEENHDMLMDMLFGKPKHIIKNIGILVYDGTNSLDVMGPRHILGQILSAKTQFIGMKPGTFITTDRVEITVDAVIDSVNQLDILIIPGGFQGTVKNVYDDKLHNWIRKIDKTTVYTASVCTGAWVLGATGLLKNKKATTHWYKAEEMLEKYGAEYVNKRYVKDGKYWTSAGVTAGMDMSLAIINDILGENYTEGVMLDMEYDPQPPIEGGTPDKTSLMMHYMMKSMYDSGLEPLVDSLELAKKKKEELL